LLWLNSLVVFALALPLGLGIGGGGFLLIYMNDFLDIPRDGAVYINLIFFLSALLTAAVGHLRAGRLSFPTLGRILLFGLPGTFIGRWLATLFSPVTLHLFLGFFLFASGIFSLFSLKKLKNAKDSPLSLDKR
jgi:uncharacterized membrane protein YfcA